MVSGHTDLSIEEFNEHYRERIMDAINAGDPIIVGGASGADRLTQELCHSLQYYNVTVSDKGQQDNRITELFSHASGFETYALRDSFMTKNSDSDIAYVRPNPMALGSGTQCNIHRRLYGEKVANDLFTAMRNMYSLGKEKQDYDEGKLYSEMVLYLKHALESH